MPIATPEIYAQMLDTAKAQGFAFPAINVSSSQTLNAALQGFADAGSDGIIQVSTGGAEYLSGPTVKNMVTGSVAFAAFAAEVAKNYPINVALHTDHCPKDKLDGFVRPLIDISAERVARGEAPLFQSHMWDGSAVPLAREPPDRRRSCWPSAPPRTSSSRSRSASSAARRTASRARSTRSSTPLPRTPSPRSRRSVLGEKGRYLTALTFGNVHGVYKPGNVKLRPEILKTAQEAIVEKSASTGRPAAPFDLVFHGGSGSTARGDRRRRSTYGVVKMNVDTDTQYAFTRPVADHMFSNYDGVLKVDGEVGNKKAYDPRAWGKAGEAGMAARVVEACANLSSTGHTLG